MEGLLVTILELELYIIAAVVLGEATLRGYGLIAWTWAGFVIAIDVIYQLAHPMT